MGNVQNHAVMLKNGRKVTRSFVTAVMEELFRLYDEDRRLIQMLDTALGGDVPLVPGAYLYLFKDWFFVPGTTDQIHPAVGAILEASIRRYGMDYALVSPIEGLDPLPPEAMQDLWQSVQNIPASVQAMALAA